MPLHPGWNLKLYSTEATSSVLERYSITSTKINEDIRSLASIPYYLWKKPCPLSLIESLVMETQLVIIFTKCKKESYVVKSLFKQSHLIIS